MEDGDGVDPREFAVNDITVFSKFIKNPIGCLTY